MLGYLQGEGLRVCDVPVQRVQLGERHGVQAAQHAAHWQEVAGGVYEQTAPGVRRRVHHMHRGPPHRAFRRHQLGEGLQGPVWSLRTCVA